MPYLILARHGQSQFNAKSLWTGIWDVPLTKKGRRDASLMARVIKDIKPAVAYTSLLSRARDTLEIILEDNHWTRVRVRASAALNERDYGDLTGMNKWSVEEQFGEEQFDKWRRGWDEPVPDGETLKHVFRRAAPYYEEHILPDIKHGQNVLVVAHGNSLRALTKFIEELSNQQVEDLDLPFGLVAVYEFDAHAKIIHKETRLVAEKPPTA